MLWSLRWTMLNENPLFLDSTYRTNRYLGRSVSSAAAPGTRVDVYYGDLSVWGRWLRSGGRSSLAIAGSTR
jgi:hypothetical protein